MELLLIMLSSSNDGILQIMGGLVVGIIGSIFIAIITSFQKKKTWIEPPKDIEEEDSLPNPEIEKTPVYLPIEPIPEDIKEDENKGLFNTEVVVKKEIEEIKRSNSEVEKKQDDSPTTALIGIIIFTIIIVCSLIIVAQRINNRPVYTKTQISNPNVQYSSLLSILLDDPIHKTRNEITGNLNNKNIRFTSGFTEDNVAFISYKQEVINKDYKCEANRTCYFPSNNDNALCLEWHLQLPSSQEHTVIEYYTKLYTKPNGRKWNSLSKKASYELTNPIINKCRIICVSNLYKPKPAPTKIALNNAGYLYLPSIFQIDKNESHFFSAIPKDHISGRFEKYAAITFFTAIGQQNQFDELDFNPSIYDAADRREWNNLLKEHISQVVSRNGSHILQWYPLQIKRINHKISSFYCQYTRQLHQEPPVKVDFYIIFNNNRRHELTLSYRISEKDYWKDDLEDVLNNLQINKY